MLSKIKIIPGNALKFQVGKKIKKNGVYFPFTGVLNDKNFITNISHDNVNCPKPGARNKKIWINLDNETVIKLAEHITDIMVEIKKFSKVKGSPEYNMLLSLLRYYKENQETGNITMMQAKKDYYNFITYWIKTLIDTNKIKMVISSKTMYYLGDNKGHIISQSNKNNSIWNFPLKCKILFNMCAFCGLKPIPYIKISKIVLLSVSDNIDGLILSPKHYILSYINYSDSLKMFFDYVKKSNLSIEEGNIILNEFIINLTKEKINKTVVNKDEDLQAIDDIINNIDNSSEDEDIMTDEDGSIENIDDIVSEESDDEIVDEQILKKSQSILNN